MDLVAFNDDFYRWILGIHEWGSGFRRREMYGGGSWFQTSNTGLDGFFEAWQQLQ